ncbi:MAG: hypothetical protein ACR2IT_13525 [Pirellulales bacterium]
MTATYDDSDDDWDDIDEELDETGDDSEGDEPTIPCPYCRHEILEDSPRCPACDRFISSEDSPGLKKPLWVVLTAVVCLLMALMWALAMG